MAIFALAKKVTSIESNDFTLVHGCYYSLSHADQVYTDFMPTLSKNESDLCLPLSSTVLKINNPATVKNLDIHQL